MNYKKRFKELGYKLEVKWLAYTSRISKGSHEILIYWDKKKIIVHEANEDYLNEISKELLEILIDYLQEKGFFKDEC